MSDSFRCSCDSHEIIHDCILLVSDWTSHHKTHSAPGCNLNALRALSLSLSLLLYILSRCSGPLLDWSCWMCWSLSGGLQAIGGPSTGPVVRSISLPLSFSVPPARSIGEGLCERSPPRPHHHSGKVQTAPLNCFTLCTHIGLATVRRAAFGQCLRFPSLLYCKRGSTVTLEYPPPLPVHRVYYCKSCAAESIPIRA